MNCRQEKTVTLVISRAVRREITIVPEMRLADVRTALDLSNACSFSLTRNGPTLPPDIPVFQQINHRDRLYVRHGNRMEQLTFAFAEPARHANGHEAALETIQPPSEQEGMPS